MLEIIITLIGILQGILAMFNKRINWLVYAAQMVLLVIFSYINHLYGDMGQNVIYFIVCIISWFAWKPGSKSEKISTITNEGRIFILVSTLLVTAVLGYFLAKTNDPLPYVDAFTTVTTIVALVLMALHKLETWVVWFINDLAYMYQYFNLPDQAIYLFFLYVIWTIMAVISLVKWKRIYIDYD